MNEPGDEKPDLGSFSEWIDQTLTNSRRCLAAVDQMAAACNTALENLRRERVREKWRNLAASVACALAGCLVGALVFGR